jgi:DNA-binding HxlR family transcriptional regulator
MDDTAETAEGSPSGSGAGEESGPPEGSEAPTVPGLSAGLSKREAEQLRAALSAGERERVEATVTELLDLFGRAHAMGILSAFAFADGPLRFSELEGELDVAPNTLSARLSELTEAGLLDREAYDEVPPRVEYTPTERAESLFPVFAHLHHWAIEHEL